MSHRRWHTHTHTHFNHFVSCQERNVSQPRSPLIPVIPSLIRLPLCLPSGSVLPLFPFLSPFLSSSFFFFFFKFKHTHPLPPTYTGLFSLASSFSRMEMLLLLPDGAGLQECLLFHCNTLFPAHRAVIIAIRPVCPNLATRERTVCV